MARVIKPTPHPVLEIPTAAQAMEWGEAEYTRRMAWREEIIRREAKDPLRNQYEPPTWKIADATMGFPWVDEKYVDRVLDAFELEHPIQVLLINGGNRASKSRYAASRVQKVLQVRDEAEAFCFHAKEQMSIDYHQTLFWMFLPPELRTGKQIREEVTYVAYKRATGFAGQHYVLPNGSMNTFWNYSMDMTSVEGANLDMAWCDELAKVALVETLEYRVAERNGWMIISFMPKEGYTPLVKVFQDNARVVWESDAFLLPKDGGEPDVSRALGGMTEDEMAELHVAITERRKPKCRTCRPEDCEKWLEGKRGQPEVPEGRRFEKAPRVLQPPLTQDRYRRRLSIFFYSSDNPFANPLRIAQTVAGRTREHVLERWYGLASRSATARFTAFDLKVHVVPADRIPRTGTNRHWQDPASARNFANVWTRETPEALYVYREWPGNYDVPGEGVLGAWAIPDDEKADGKRGPAQKSLGWGLVDYKKEIARVERWAAYRPAPPEGMSDRDTVPEWEPGGQDCERIEGRYLDRRFGNTPHAGPEGPVTLFDEYAEVGLDFLETRGGAEENGLALIADALAWDKTREINYFNRPRLYVSDACENVITALMMWTGEDGKRGACKDWIDLLRYVFEEGVDCLAAGAGVSGQSRGSY